jgi:NRAMP (natural resistance-associated macrophage protein)-like metal ion transporter
MRDVPAHGYTYAVTRMLVSGYDVARNGGPGGETYMQVESHEPADTTLRARLAHIAERLQRPRGHPLPLQRVGRWLRIIGPGLITGAADDDPSGIGTYSQAGAAYGTGTLWLALYMLPLMIAVQEMCGRIGLVTGKGLAGIVKAHYSRRVLRIAVMLLLIANTINIGADLGAMAASTRLLIPGAPFFLVLFVFAVVMIVVEVYVPYKHYARVLKVLSLTLLAYIVTGFVIHPQWGPLLVSTIIPQMQFTPQYLALVVALLGTTISPYLFFWQASEEVEESALQKPSQDKAAASSGPKPVRLLQQLKDLRLDTALGMLASEVTTWFIIMTAGSTLHLHGITTIQTADQAAVALRPLAGPFAETLFALGIIGTGLIAIPVLAGSSAYGVAEAFGWSEGLGQTARNARGFYGVIALATLVGLLINFVGINPITALVYTAIINGVIAVPLLVLVLLVANNRGIMGAYTNGRLSNTVGIFTAGLMGIAAIVTVISLFRR